MLDSHSHVWAHDGGVWVPTQDQLEQYCDAAAANGVSVLTITEHCHRFERIIAEVLPHWDRPGAPALQAEADRILEIERGGDLDAYVDAVVTAKDRGLPIRLGMEVDHLPGTAEAMASVLADYPFDFHLGSVHWLGAWLFDAFELAPFIEEWDRWTVDDAWAAYVDAIVELCGSGMVDAAAHLDLMKVAGHRAEDPERHHARLVEAIVANDVVVEISSAGLRKPIGELYPGPDLLRMLVDAGARFTTASDAHRVDQLGFGYDVLRSTLEDFGITELVRFDARRPVAVPISHR